MKPINDEQLLLIYYREAKQQEINDCLQDEQANQKLSQLEADMNAIEQADQDAAQKHQLPEDYGQQLWQKIADKLEQPETLETQQPNNWLQKLKHALAAPQYSLASLAVVLGLVMVAFYAGKQQNDAVLNAGFQEQLLAQNIQLHLTQSEIFLTQVSNDSGTYNAQATAQRLLSSNRIFKRALASHESQFTHQVLQDLEPIFLEYANQSSVGEFSSQIHGQQPQANWVSDQNSNDLPNNLLFQIKAMKQQLAQKNDII